MRLADDCTGAKPGFSKTHFRPLLSKLARTAFPPAASSIAQQRKTILCRFRRARPHTRCRLHPPLYISSSYRREILICAENPQALDEIGPAPPNAEYGLPLEFLTVSHLGCVLRPSSPTRPHFPGCAVGRSVLGPFRQQYDPLARQLRG